MIKLEYFKTYINKHKILIIVFLIFLLPRIVSIGADISNYDASYWYPRMDRFTRNLEKGDLSNTYQQYHPGVMLLWISGIPKYLFENLFELVFNFNPRFMAHHFIRLQTATLLPLMVVLSLIGTYIYSLLSKIINNKFAIIFVVVFSLEPFLLGTSRFVHVTALSAFLMYASFLSLYYHYATKHDSMSYLYVSSVLIGLALLTKTDSGIVFLFNLLIITFVNVKDKQYKEWIIDGFLYGLIAFLVFYVLFPAMWVEPIRILFKIIGGGKDTAFNSSGANTIFGFRYLYYLEVFFYRSLPITFVTFITSLYISIKHRWDKNTKQFLVVNMVLLIFFTIILTIPAKIKDRYLISLYPMFLVSSSVTYYYIFYIQNNKLLKKVILVFLIFSYVLTVYKYHPVYSYYYSELIGGQHGLESFGLKVKNRGEYYAQAALFLNDYVDDPGSKTVLIAHKEQTRTFPPFFIGKAYSSPGLLADKQEANFVISRADFLHIVPMDKCNLIRTFGPKAPFKYNALYLFECEGLDNTYKEFRN